MNDIVLSKAVGRPGEIRFIKVPEPLYQIFFDTAHNQDKERAKKNIFEGLKNWISSKYPGYGIIHFIDLNQDDVNVFNRILTNRNTYMPEEGAIVTLVRYQMLPKGFRFSWGMYVLIGIGIESDLADEQALQDAIHDRNNHSSQNQLPHGKSQQNRLEEGSAEESAEESST